MCEHFPLVRTLLGLIVADRWQKLIEKLFKSFGIKNQIPFFPPVDPPFKRIFFLAYIFTDIYLQIINSIIILS